MARLCPIETQPAQAGTGKDQAGASTSQRLKLGRHARLERLDACHDDVIATGSDDGGATGAQFRNGAVDGDLAGATFSR